MRRPPPAVLFAAAVAHLAAQGFRERVEVQLVRVELLATDSDGRPDRDHLLLNRSLP